MSHELPQFSIKQLLDAGAHFGHKTMRRNPKMTKYIHTNRNGVSIIDLNKTASLLHNSLKVVRDIAKNNGRILFVATKKQAIDTVAEAATRCGQYYVNFRWLGGMLTNWKTVSKSIKTLKQTEEKLADTEFGYNKKEKLVLQRQQIKLEKTLGGIKNMGGYPDLVVIIDTHKESLAILEAKTLKLPIMAIVDTNCNPDDITFPIPGNDDSAKSIKLFCRLLSDAAIAGVKDNMAQSGIDVASLNEEDLQLKISKTKKTEAKPAAKKAEVKKPAKKKEFVRKSDKVVLNVDAKAESKAKPKAKAAAKPKVAKAAVKAGDAKVADKKPAVKKAAEAKETK